jgi:hypothetical protein
MEKAGAEKLVWLAVIRLLDRKGSTLRSLIICKRRSCGQDSSLSSFDGCHESVTAFPYNLCTT